jgi:hypothetical protein
LEKELQTPDYAAILADMEAKKSALETAIAGLRAALMTGALGASGEFQASATALNPTPPSGGYVDLPRGAFLGKTAKEAIRLFLSTIRRKQTNKEIAQALQEGGLESAGNFDKYITSALFRLKEDGELLRFDDGWGLSEWYNEAFRTKFALSSKTPAKRTKVKRKKAAKKASASPPAPESKTAPPAGIDARITALLESQMPTGYKSHDLSREMSASVGVINFALVRLLKKGTVRHGEDGKYYAAKEHQ